MKAYQCYKKYPAESADITIWILRDSRFYPHVAVEFYGKDPLEEPFDRKLMETAEEAEAIAENYIKEQDFDRVIVRG